MLNRNEMLSLRIRGGFSYVKMILRGQRLFLADREYQRDRVS